MCPVNDVLFERFIGLLKQLDNVEHSAEVYKNGSL